MRNKGEMRIYVACLAADNNGRTWHSLQRNLACD